MKTKVVYFGVFMHVGFVSGYNHAKTVIGQYATMREILWDWFNPMTPARFLNFWQKLSFFKNMKINLNA